MSKMFSDKLVNRFGGLKSDRGGEVDSKRVVVKRIKGGGFKILANVHVLVVCFLRQMTASFNLFPNNNRQIMTLKSVKSQFFI